MTAPISVSAAIRMIDIFDTNIFLVNSATSIGDRTSLLRVQALVRRMRPGYRLLEVGSYLGGTLFPYLLDPACKSILSVDIRPDEQPDERARYFSYAGITTETMMDALRAGAPDADYAKLETFAGDASTLPRPQTSDPKAVVAMLDGEHTNVATFRDFFSVYPHLDPNGVVVFHDCNLIIDAIKNIERALQFLEVPYQLFLLPDVVGVLALGDAIEPARSALGPVSFDEAEFTRSSKVRLREEIAQAVAEGAHSRV